MLPSENTIAGKLAFVFMCLCALGLAFSISIAQTGLGLTFLIFLATLLSNRGRKTINLSGAANLRLLYAGLIAWVVWRIFHIAISPQALRELIEAREVWLMLIPVFVYLYASDRNRLATLATAFVLGTAISSAYGLWKMRAEIFDLWTRGRGLSTMHHLNYAGVSALASLIGFGLTWSYYYAGNRKRALMTFLLTFLSFTGLWLTKSKGAIAAFAAVLPVFVYVQLHSKAQRRIFLVLVVAAAAIMIPRLPQSVAEQYRFPDASVHLGSQAERRDLWQTGYAMIQEKILVGWGERGYNIAYPRFQVAGAQGVAEYDQKNLEASHMHNDFINTWVLYGAVGLAIQLFYYFFGGFVYLRERFKIRRMSDRPLAAAGATALLLMALMGITQCHFTSEIVQMSFWLAVGILFSVLESDRSGATV